MKQGGVGIPLEFGVGKHEQRALAGCIIAHHSVEGNLERHRRRKPHTSGEVGRRGTKGAFRRMGIGESSHTERSIESVRIDETVVFLSLSRHTAAGKQNGQ